MSPYRMSWTTWYRKKLEKRKTCGMSIRSGYLELHFCQSCKFYYCGFCAEKLETSKRVVVVKIRKRRKLEDSALSCFVHLSYKGVAVGILNESYQIWWLMRYYLGIPYKIPLISDHSSSVSTKTSCCTSDLKIMLFHLSFTLPHSNITKLSWLRISLNEQSMKVLQ